MPVVHIIEHADYGQLRIEDPRLRIDREGKHEYYAMIIDAAGEEIAYSLHDNRVDARDSARRLAQRLRCPPPR
jgi:hypothetical protein